MSYPQQLICWAGCPPAVDEANITPTYTTSSAASAPPITCADARSLLARGLTARPYAARAAFEKAGVTPEDVDVIQLQDTDAGAEIIHMAECGFCGHGEQEKLLADGATDISGPMPINTDGGLIANGEPIGASGLRQIHELVRQLRGEAGDRQVAGEPRVGFAQLYGAPGTAAATILTT